MNYNELLKKSNYARKDVPINIEDSYEYKRNKNISDKLYLYNGGLDNVSLVGRGDLSLSEDIVYNNDKSLCMKTNVAIENVIPRPSSTISFTLDHLDLTNYNYFGAYVYIKATGHQNFYVHFMTGNSGHYTNHAPIIVPNKWQFVSWDALHIVRDDICTFSITPFLMGCECTALPDIEVYVDSIFAYNDKPLYDNGWDLENRIAYSHCGYMINERKEAIVSFSEIDTFKVIGDKEYTFNTKVVESKLGKYLLLDFSDVTCEGEYIIKCGDITSNKFIISDKCYHSSILKSLNFLRSLRCGEHVPGVHNRCHLNCKSVHPVTGATVPNFGGWHDAGDVSQFEICTAEIASSLLELYLTQDDEYLKDRILDEARVGLDWLIHTRFKDGYRALAVTYSIWRDNVLTEDNKSVITNKAEEGSFENFLSAISFGLGALCFKGVDDMYSESLKRLAIEDLEHAIREYNEGIYTVRWGKPITSQTLGCALVALSYIYKLTKDNKYIDLIKKYSLEVIKTQETDFNHPLKGFFYEDVEHNYVLSYEHRGHEEYPCVGLAKVYELNKEFDILDKDLSNEILKCLNLYASFCINSTIYTYPYNLLPSGVYNKDKVNLEHFTAPRKTPEELIEYLSKQIESGDSLGNNWYLRKLPISFTRRGFLATQLSKTKGLSAIMNIVNVDHFDDYMKPLVIRQIEWTLGFNPFSTSQMYGEGYDYHDLYVAFSRQMVGALPVGIMTKGDGDAPYWPDFTNAVFKEIWGHTTSKFLGVLSDILKK